MPQSDDQERAQAFLRIRNDVVPQVAGAALQLLVPGAAGTLGAPLLSSAIEWLAGDFASRGLSHREAQRVRAVLDVASAHIAKKIRLGHEARSDDFFTGAPGNRSFYEEIAEGVLLAAQREHEERKALFLGYLLANFAFNDFDRREANYLLRLMTSLSWTQLRLLAIYNSDDRYALRRRNYSDHGHQDSDRPLMTNTAVLLMESDELWRLGLIALSRSVSSHDRPDLNAAIASIPDPFHVVFSDMVPVSFAVFLIQAAELDRIEQDDLNELIPLMR